LLCFRRSGPAATAAKEHRAVKKTAGAAVTTKRDRGPRRREHFARHGEGRNRSAYAAILDLLGS